MLILVCFQIYLLVLAAWRDVASRLIPNRICIVLALISISSRLLIAGPTAMACSLAIAAGMFLMLLLLHNFQILGGGDVKLLVALALGLPLIGVMSLFIVTALAGGVLCMVHLMMRCLPLPRLAKTGSSVFRRVYVAERWRIIRHAPLPYGVAIACGGTWAILQLIGV
jgi:prepilin peptidase CpaA